MLSCPFCNKQIKNNVLLMNHLYKHSQYDEQHKSFNDIKKQLNELFYNERIDTFADLKDFNIPDYIDYDSLIIYWKKEFGIDAYNQRSRLIKQRIISMSLLINQYKTKEEAEKHRIIEDFILNCELQKIKKEELNYDIDMNVLQQHKCPVCKKSFGRSLLSHCKKSFNIHKYFLEEQKQLALSLKNDFSINCNEDLLEKGFAFTYNYFNEILKETYGKEFMEEKRKYKEKMTKSLNNPKHKQFLGTQSALKIDEIKDYIRVPKINFYEKEYKKETYNECPVCGMDISETTLFNHYVLMRSDEKHKVELIKYCQKLVNNFNNLNTIQENKITNDLWKTFFTKEDIKLRKKLKRINNNNKLQKNILWSFENCNGNIFAKVDWNQVDIEKVKNDNKIYVCEYKVKNDICPICGKKIGRSFFEHLKYNRDEEKHKQLFKEQIYNIILLHFEQDEKRKKLIEENIIIKKSISNIEKMLFS